MQQSIIGQILKFAIKKGASDIHISEEAKIIFRIEGKLKHFDGTGNVSKENTKLILLELLGNSESLLTDFSIKKDMDFAYIYEDGTSFRVNAFYKLGKVSLVMRQIESTSKTMDELGLPPGAKKFTKLKQGLVLITGPTGSGKSTSMVSILNTINKERNEHILTIEDPIEFVFKDDKSVFSQREVGRDTNNFSSALRSAFREDPDIIVVGELRDKETVALAMELAETGHLVFGTLHTSGSIATITRLISFFPPEIQSNIMYKLGDILYGVLSQRLIPRIDQEGRTGIFEIMIGTPAIRNLIRNGDLVQIDSHIETGQKEGMIHMKKYADSLARAGIVKEEDYINYFKDEIEN